MCDCGDIQYPTVFIDELGALITTGCYVAPAGGEALEYVWLLQGLSSCSALRSLTLKGPLSREAHALVGQLTQLTSLDCAFDRFYQDLEPPREQLTLLQS
jgi:hypothetical protein